MAIDRVTPSSSTLTIPERIAREQPGQHVPIPPVARAPDDGPQFAVDSGLPAAVGALADAPSGKQPATAAVPAAALAGKLAAEALLGEAMSMQPNQAFASRQLTWHAPEPSAMAASWMVMIRTYAEQRAALVPQTQGKHVPASLFLSDQAPSVLRDGRVPPQLVAKLEAWRFAVYAWGAEKLVLRVVARDPGESDGGDHGGGAGARQRRRPRVALRLEVHLPGLDKVVLQMEPQPTGALLEIGAAQAGAMQHMRTLLPQIGAMATRSGVQIVRVRLMRELPAADTPQPTPAQVALLTEPLFRTMAEVAVLLSQPLPADKLYLEPKG